MKDVKKVLVPIDFSEHSDRALEYAISICDKYGAELHLLHVLEVRVAGPPQFAMGLAMSNREEESSEAVMKELEKMPTDFAGTVIRDTAHGSPFDAITKYAKEHSIDLISLGTHGRTGLSHVLLGSVAENVSRHAPCPVLVVR